MQKAPEVLLHHGYSCPIDPRDGLVQHAFQTQDTTFERITSSPSLLKDFNTFMGNTMGARSYWVDWYPVQAQILEGADPEKPLIVDVGAGKGHDLLAFHGKFPATGKLVLQDLQPVIETLDDLDPVIEKVAYDFFTEQAVKGTFPTYPLLRRQYFWFKKTQWGGLPPFFFKMKAKRRNEWIHT
jgi:hypothetical protein